VPEIMAASILAKTARDAWMEEYARTEPAYLFDKHKGYPTAEHRALVIRLGPSAIQRRSFRVSAP
jgi:ribonuclease HII